MPIVVDSGVFWEIGTRGKPVFAVETVRVTSAYGGVKPGKPKHRIKMCRWVTWSSMKHRFGQIVMEHPFVRLVRWTVAVLQHFVGGYSDCSSFDCGAVGGTGRLDLPCLKPFKCPQVTGDRRDSRYHILFVAILLVT